MVNGLQRCVLLMQEITELALAPESGFKGRMPTQNREALQTLYTRWLQPEICRQAIAALHAATHDSTFDTMRARTQRRDAEVEGDEAQVVYRSAGLLTMALQGPFAPQTLVCRKSAPAMPMSAGLHGCA